MSNAVAAQSFEEALGELTNIATRLERGQVPLAESIALYERGVQLRQHCERILRDAQLRVDKLLLSDEAGVPPKLTPFDEV